MEFNDAARFAHPSCACSSSSISARGTAPFIAHQQPSLASNGRDRRTSSSSDAKARATITSNAGARNVSTRACTTSMFGKPEFDLHLAQEGDLLRDLVEQRHVRPRQCDRQRYARQTASGADVEYPQWLITVRPRAQRGHDRQRVEQMMGKGLAGLDRGQVVHAVPAGQELGKSDQRSSCTGARSRPSSATPSASSRVRDHDLRPRAFRHPPC